MTTTWKIFDAKSQKVDGLITEVTYGCTVQLENYIDRTIGNIELTGDPKTKGFIPYTDLTEEIILGWVKTLLGTETISNIEISLQNSVTAQKTAKETETINSGLPWRQ